MKQNLETKQNCARRSFGALKNHNGICRYREDFSMRKTSPAQVWMFMESCFIV